MLFHKLNEIACFILRIHAFNVSFMWNTKHHKNKHILFTYYKKTPPKKAVNTIKMSKRSHESSVSSGEPNKRFRKQLQDTSTQTSENTVEEKASPSKNCFSENTNDEYTDDDYTDDDYTDDESDDESDDDVGSLVDFIVNDASMSSNSSNTADSDGEEDEWPTEDETDEDTNTDVHTSTIGKSDPLPTRTFNRANRGRRTEEVYIDPNYKRLMLEDVSEVHNLFPDNDSSEQDDSEDADFV